MQREWPTEANSTLKIGIALTQAQVAALARLALQAIFREFPNKPANVMTGPGDVLSPRQMHPAFFGSFDWHSSVHGHWMLARLRRLYPNHAIAGDIRDSLMRHLSADNVQAEAEYLLKPENRSFERMYGWAWALRLAAELAETRDEDGRRWQEAMRPVEQALVRRIAEYLPKLEFPIRVGVHPDTAFALAQFLDYSRTTRNRELEALVVERSRDYFLNDRSYPFAYEPSGEDFFSSGMNEADLMRRVLSPPEFSAWLDAFWPTLREGEASKMPQPVAVSDVTDPKLVHFAGLDLSRAWCLDGIARCLPRDDGRSRLLEESASRHADAGFAYVFSGHYEGEHWLATFAVYLLTRAGG